MENMFAERAIFRIFIFTLALFWASFSFLPLSLSETQAVGGQTQKRIEIKFFYSPTCLHCARAQEFLDDLEKRYPEVKMIRFNIFQKESIELLKELYEEYKVPKQEWGLAPVIFTEENYFVGFDEAIAKEIEICTENCIAGQEGKEKPKDKISLPFIGEIDIAKYSLPALAVILGFFDGFNVCSLGALVLILGLVLAAKSRKKILVFGGIFIATTAIIYGLLIMAWYRLFAFFAPYLTFMKILIGVLGVGGGIYFLEEFLRFKRQGAVCEGQKGKKGLVSRFSLKMKEILDKGGSVFAVMLAVLLFAAAITVIEFPCSAAVPVFFAGLLAQAKLPAFFYLLYIAVFVLFYMLDELVVFLFTFFTLSLKLASNRFVVWVTLIESIVLFLLGFYYLFGFLIFH